MPHAVTDTLQKYQKLSPYRESQLFICNEYMNLWRLSNGELNLANTSTIKPEKGKVGTLLEKSLDLELNGILGPAFRLSSNSRREVRTVGCYKLIF